MKKKKKHKNYQLQLPATIYKRLKLVANFVPNNMRVDVLYPVMLLHKK